MDKCGGAACQQLKGRLLHLFVQLALEGGSVQRPGSPSPSPHLRPDPALVPVHYAQGLGVGDIPDLDLARLQQSREEGRRTVA